MSDPPCHITEVLSRENCIKARTLSVCLSDQVSNRISNVINGTSSVVDYAYKLLKGEYDKLRKLILVPYIGDADLPEEVAKSFLFDLIVEQAVRVRIASVTLPSGADINAMIAGVMFSLTSSDLRKYSEVPFSGLTQFSDAVAGHYLATYPLSNDSIDFIADFLAEVDDIDQENWIFYDTAWYKAFASRPDLLHSFKMLSAMTVLIRTTPQMVLDNVFQVRTKDIETLVHTFMELRADENTPVGAIIAFLKTIAWSVDSIPDNLHSKVTLFSSYDQFLDIHNQLTHVSSQSSVVTEG